MLKEGNDMKEKMKNPNNNIKCIFIVLNAQFLQKLTISKQQILFLLAAVLKNLELLIKKNWEIY